MQTDDQSELVVPTVHSNGSGAHNLFEQYKGALEALRGAIEALPVPHGRDYYVQEDEQAYRKARAQFEDQFRKLREVEEDLTTLLRAISRQGDR